MKRLTSRMITLGLLAFFLSVPSFAFAQEKKPMAKPPSRAELRLALRDLWVGHIFWVRDVVFTTKYGDKDAAKVAEEQVVQNARSIADAIAPYYGKEASDKLFTLLAGHYGAVKDYMTAAFAGNSEGKKAAADKISKNAEEIAAFLSSANPNWPKQTLLSALVAHGGHHMSQIDAVQGKDFTGEAKVWDAMKTHIYTIADVLANGIAKQFGSKAKTK